MDKDAAEKISAFALKELGHVDILINNAGGSRPSPSMRLTANGTRRSR